MFLYKSKWKESAICSLKIWTRVTHSADVRVFPLHKLLTPWFYFPRKKKKKKIIRLAETFRVPLYAFKYLYFTYFWYYKHCKWFKIFGSFERTILQMIQICFGTFAISTFCKMKFCQIWWYWRSYDLRSVDQWSRISESVI